jgi:hypothetical protein
MEGLGRLWTTTQRARVNLDFCASGTNSREDVVEVDALPAWKLSLTGNAIDR